MWTCANKRDNECAACMHAQVNLYAYCQIKQDLLNVGGDASAIERHQNR